METRKGTEESGESGDDEQITEVSSSLIRYDKRLRRWRQQIKDVNDELDFITPDRVYDLDSMSAERLAGLRERLRLICEEMDNA